MSTRNGSGPSCPKPQRLRELIDKVCESDLDASFEHDLVDALDWLATSLENRNLYHKKQQLKRKAIISLAKERGLLDEANALTESMYRDLAANTPLDRKDEIELNLGGDDEDERG